MKAQRKIESTKTNTHKHKMPCDRQRCEEKGRNTHILSSRQILGPMTLAAPEFKRKARCFEGQGADRPHLYLRGRDSTKP